MDARSSARVLRRARRQTPSQACRLAGGGRGPQPGERIERRESGALHAGIMPGDAATGKFPLSWTCHHGNVPTLTDLARKYTNLSGADLEWLHSLVSDWQLLADLSFADLILWVPQRIPEDAADRGWVAVAQMRPTTGPTSFPDDVVGSAVGPGERHCSTRRAGSGASGGKATRLDQRRAGARRGDTSDQGRPGHRGHRAVHQPEFARARQAGSSSLTCRAPTTWHGWFPRARSPTQARTRRWCVRPGSGTACSGSTPPAGSPTPARTRSPPTAGSGSPRT